MHGFAAIDPDQLVPGGGQGVKEPASFSLRRRAALCERRLSKFLDDLGARQGWWLNPRGKVAKFKMIRYTARLSIPRSTPL